MNVTPTKALPAVLTAAALSLGSMYLGLPQATAVVVSPTAAEANPAPVVPDANPAPVVPDANPAPEGYTNITPQDPTAITQPDKAYPNGQPQLAPGPTCTSESYALVDSDSKPYLLTMTDTVVTRNVMTSDNGIRLDQGLYKFDMAVDKGNVYGLHQNGNILISSRIDGSKTNVTVDYSSIFGNNKVGQNPIGAANSLSAMPDPELFIGFDKSPIIAKVTTADLLNAPSNGTVTATEVGNFETILGAGIVGSGGDFVRAADGGLWAVVHKGYTSNQDKVTYLAHLDKPVNGVYTTGTLYGKLVAPDGTDAVSYGLTYHDGKLIGGGFYKSAPSGGATYIIPTDALRNADGTIKDTIEVQTLATSPKQVYGLGSEHESDLNCFKEATTVEYQDATNPDATTVITRWLSPSHNPGDTLTFPGLPNNGICTGPNGRQGTWEILDPTDGQQQTWKGEFNADKTQLTVNGDGLTHVVPLTCKESDEPPTPETTPITPPTEEPTTPVTPPTEEPTEPTTTTNPVVPPVTTTTPGGTIPIPIPIPIPNPGPGSVQPPATVAPTVHPTTQPTVEPTQQQPSTLARTGAHTTQLTALAALTLLTGAGLLALRRIRA